MLSSEPTQTLCIKMRFQDTDEHPDVSLGHESECSLSVFGSGLVVFENVETDEGPWHMISAPVSDTLKLWHLLAKGNLDELKQFPWVSCYGLHA